MKPIILSRMQILAYRRHAQALDERLAPSADALRRAAWAGLQDSMPRAALLSIHARVAGAHAGSWAEAPLVQLWGPRYSTYVVAEPDRALFTLGRLGNDARARDKAEAMADRLQTLLAGRTMTDREAGEAMGLHPNALRYGAPSGRILIRWEGARAPLVWVVPPPGTDPVEAQNELARRYLHVFGVTTPIGFAEWAGISPQAGATTFQRLRGSLCSVQTPIGDGWMVDEDAELASSVSDPPAAARLLPSGDTYFLLQNADRELLVPDPAQRAALWPSRVWPGALLVRGDVVGTWRRAQATLTIETWRALTTAERSAVEEEAQSLPLPGVQGRIRTRWTGP